MPLSNARPEQPIEHEAEVAVEKKKTRKSPVDGLTWEEFQALRLEVHRMWSADPLPAE